MYVVDITRINDKIGSDLLFGKNSMDAKRKTIDYIQAFALAHYNICLEDDVIDQNLNIDSFSLKHLLETNYAISIADDLLIQSFITDKDNCLFIKCYDETKEDFPIFGIFNKNEETKANSFMIYLINDLLIKKFNDNLLKYDKVKLDFGSDISKYNQFSIRGIKTNLYKDSKFLEELLSNDVSLNNLKNKNINIII